MFQKEDLDIQEISDFYFLASHQQPITFHNYGVGQFWKLLSDNPLSSTLIESLYLKFNYDDEVKKIRDDNSGNKHLTQLLEGITGDAYIALCISLIKVFSEKSGNYIYKKSLQTFEKGESGAITEKDHANFVFTYLEPILLFLKRNDSYIGNKIMILNRYRLYCHNFAREEVDSFTEVQLTQKHLPEFLFRSGIDYPLSETNVPSGRIDVFNEKNSLLIEAKIYNTKKDIKRIGQCLNQCIGRLSNFNFFDSYAVIFNKSETCIEIGDWDGHIMNVPYWKIKEKYLFILIVDSNERMLKNQDSQWKNSLQTVYISKKEFFKNC